MMKIRCRTGMVLIAALQVLPAAAMAETTVKAGDASFTNKGLVAIGRIPASQRDRYGETFGSGSGMAIDPTTWKKDGDSYTGSLWLLPDRGYNVEGTTDYTDRLNRIEFRLTPATATPPAARQRRLIRARDRRPAG